LQNVADAKSVVIKIATTLVAKFGNIVSLRYVDDLSKKLWQTTTVANEPNTYTIGHCDLTN
jgi:surface antigen